MSSAIAEMLVFGARSEQDRVPMKSTELSEHERALIDFEREWWQLGSRKDVGIRARFDMSASTFLSGPSFTVSVDVKYGHRIIEMALARNSSPRSSS